MRYLEAIITVFMFKIALSFVMLVTINVHAWSSISFLSSAQFVNKANAAAILSTEDAFTKHWSTFDIDARLGKRGGRRDELFALIGAEVRMWSEEQKLQVTRIISEIDVQIVDNGFIIDFPDTIFLVKTSGAEEGGAPAYTRQNAIVLAESILSGNRSDLKRVLIHELFHILSRSSLEFRRSMYRIIGFMECNEISYPADLEDLRITNPDAPRNDSYITVQYAGEPVYCMMIIYANRPYDGGSFFQYINVGLLRVQTVGDSMQIQYNNGQPVVYKIEEVDNFYEQTGKNTLYVIHPEEILADNFVFAITGKGDLPSPEVVRRMRVLLTNKD